MDASVKEEPSEVTEEMDALYEDVMENGVEMETIEVDDWTPSADHPSCSSRPSGAIPTPRRENTKLMTINVRRSVKGVFVTPIYSARSMWSQKATSRVQATKHFTVVVPRRTPFDEHFQQPHGQFAARSDELVNANIGTRSAPIVLDGEEPSIEGEEEPEVMHDELSIPGTNDDAKATSAYVADACAEAMPSLPAEAGFSPAESGSNEAPIQVDINEPTDRVAEVPPDAVQVSSKECDVETTPGTSNSVAVVGPMRRLEAVLTARKAQKTLRSSTDRLRQQNRVAAHRYRRRRHEQRKRTQRELVEAERRNAELKATMALIESQIKMLKESLTTE